MTYEEALEITQKSHDELRHIPEQDNLSYTWRVIEALKKQIPKKPIVTLGSVPHYRCPVCRKDIFNLSYCAWCGQKIGRRYT